MDVCRVTGCPFGPVSGLALNSYRAVAGGAIEIREQTKIVVCEQNQEKVCRTDKKGPPAIIQCQCTSKCIIRVAMRAASLVVTVLSDDNCL